MSNNAIEYISDEQFDLYLQNLNKSNSYGYIFPEKVYPANNNFYARSLDNMNLSYSIISDMYYKYCTFSKLDLSRSSFYNCNFIDCTFINCSINHTIFDSCTFNTTQVNSSMFIESIFRNCKFTEFKFKHSFGTSVTFDSCDVERMKLQSSSFMNSFVLSSDLSAVDQDVESTGFEICCPEEGEFVAYKKLRHNIIAELRIPADALRSSAGSKKCRCSKAFVVSLTTVSGEKTFRNSVASMYDGLLYYEENKFVEAPDFDTNRWNECSSGIHFFMHRIDAVNYKRS